MELEHAQHALARVNERRSPNRKREQFRDSLIWEAVRTIAGESEVHFVTNDTAFFASDKTAMAEDLAEECERDSLTIFLYRDLRQLLPVLSGTAPPLDYQAIAQDILGHLTDYLERTTAPYDFVPGGLTESAVQAFATEDHNRLVLTYELSGALDDNSSSTSVVDRRGQFTIRGDGTYDLNSGQVVEANPDRCTVSYHDEEGEKKVSQNIVLGAASIHLGAPPPQRLSIRQPLDGAD